jgi:muconate cycloisomerase
MDGNQIHHQLLADDVLAEPLRLEGGTLAVPHRPGLGIVLDDDKVEFYARQYQEHGQYYNFSRPDRI